MAGDFLSVSDPDDLRIHVPYTAGMNPGTSNRLLRDAVLLGVVGAICAQAFVWSIEQVSGWVAAGPDASWWIPVATTLGGLVSGILVFRFAPEAEGHGTDTVVKSFHQECGELRPRVSLVKLLASAFTIGSGGSAGREGPTALIAAGIGSAYGAYGKRGDYARRMLLLMGMAAGLSAIFKSPIGAAVFAVEVLYSEMEVEGRALIYTLLAAVVAYAVNGFMAGWDPLFHVAATTVVHSAPTYFWFGLLGIAAGIVATAIPMVFYGIRDLFRKLHVPVMLKPAIGGLAVGLIALFMPEVLGGGYRWIQAAMDGQMLIKTMALLIVLKMVTFSLTIGSGGSGGVFAPTLVVGAMLGGVFGQLVGDYQAAFVVVGMAACFSGAARVPIAAMLMVTEMTGGYQLLGPTALAVVIAFALQQALSSRLTYRSLYEAQVSEPGDSPAHRLRQE